MADLREWIEKYRRSIVVFSLIFSALILTTVISQLLMLRSNAAYRENLTQSDIYYQEQRYDAALQKLRLAFVSSRSPGDFLRIIKRAQRLSRRGISPDFPPRVMKEGLSRFPGNQPLLALYVNYLLEMDEIQAAAAKSRSLKADRFTPLKVEALLRAGLDPGDTGSMNDLADASLPLTPMAMADPEAMYQAGLLTGDYRYFVNSILMYAALGDVEQASRIGLARAKLLASRGETLLLTRLAYDAGLFDRAGDISRLISPEDSGIQREVTSMLADLYFYRGEPEKSYALLEMLVLNSENPGALAFTNLLALEHAHGVLPGGRVAGTDISERAARAYPSSERLSGLLSTISGGGEQDFHSRKSFYFRNLPQSYRSDILELMYRYREKSEEFAIEDGINLLWDLHNRYPEDRELRDLLLYFLSIHDHRSEIEQLLSLNSAADDPRINVYRGFLKFLNGQEDAARVMLSAASDEGSYAASFNLGLLELSLRNPETALEYLGLSRTQILTASGGTAAESGRLYSTEYREILVYLTLAFLLNEEIGDARRIMNELHELESRHILMPRLEEMFAQTQRR